MMESDLPLEYVEAMQQLAGAPDTEAARLSFNALMRLGALEWYRDLDAGVRRGLDESIASTLIDNLPDNAVVSAYVSHTPDAEPGMEPFINAVHSSGSSITPCLIRYAPETEAKVAFDAIGPDYRQQLCSNELGVLEVDPEFYSPVALDDVTHILVPGAAANSYLTLPRNDGFHNLGRYLTQTHPSIRLWGVSYFWSTVVPTHKNFPMHAMVSPQVVMRS